MIITPTPASIVRNILQGIIWTLELHPTEEPVVVLERTTLRIWSAQLDGLLAMLEQRQEPSHTRGRGNTPPPPRQETPHG